MYRKFYDILFEKCISWYEDTEQCIQPGKIPVFWISGSQGNGKSVALLHLVAELLRKDTVRSIFSLKSAGGLINIFQQPKMSFDKSDTSEGPLLFLVDEIYNPEDSHEFENELRANLSVSFPPVGILTTGTEADRDRFKGLLGDIFEIFDYSTPLLNRKEAQAFYEWSQDSSGSLKIDSFKFGDTTLLEFMWEITHKDIKSFCHNLKRELDAYGLYEDTLNILAINILGITAPIDIIPDNKQPLFERFAKDENLFNIYYADTDGTVCKVCLKSIRLGKRLFKESVDPLIPLEESLAQRIVNALCVLDNQNNYEKYWNVVERILDLRTLKDFFGPVNITKAKKRMVQRIYKGHILLNKGDCVPQLLGYWLELIYKYSWLELPYRPVETALKLINEKNKELFTNRRSLIYTWLLSESYDEHEAEKIQAALLGFFKEYRHDEDIYGILAQILKKSQIKESLGAKIKDWIKPNYQHTAAYKVLSQLLKFFPDDDELWEWSLSWCRSNQENHGVFALLQTMLKYNTDNAQLEELALNIGKYNINSPYLDKIIPEIAKIVSGDSGDESTAFIDNIISIDTENPNIEKLLISFLRRSSDDIRIFKRVERRLNEYPCQKYSSDLAIAYVKARPDHLPSRQVLVEWFEHNKGNMHSSFFLSTIAMQWKSDPRVSLLIESWVKANEGRPSIYKQLAHITKNLNNDSKVGKIILNWLSDNSLNYRACNSISLLMKTRPKDNDIFNFGKDWFNNNTSHPHAYSVLASMIKVRPKDPDIKEEAFKWLNNNLNNPLSCWLIIPFLETYRTEPSVVKLVLSWLGKNIDYYGTSAILRSLLKIKAEENLFLGMFIECLNNANEIDVSSLLTLYAETNEKYSDEIFDFVKTWLGECSDSVYRLYCPRLSFSVFKRLECESFRPATFVIPANISSAFGKNFYTPA